ncbi:MAG TPA: hypothetical protein VHL34_06090 [Rhizomicrobium sp.]|jgi:hypothetical protein|nr:hypothetical protein [Rhizomicrobium sp.]
MIVRYGPVETEVLLQPSGTIAIDQRIADDPGDRAYSSITLDIENAEAIALEILRLISVSRHGGR